MEITSISGLAFLGCVAFGAGGFSVVLLYRRPMARLRALAAGAPEPERQRVTALDPRTLSAEVDDAVFGTNEHWRPSPGLDELEDTLTRIGAPGTKPLAEYAEQAIQEAGRRLGASSSDITEPVPVITDLGIEPDGVFPPGTEPDTLSSDVLAGAPAGETDDDWLRRLILDAMKFRDTSLLESQQEMSERVRAVYAAAGGV